MIEQIGRYRIAGELGRGAMGVVYRAEDPTIGRTVAIKSIRLADLSDSRERDRLRARILHEARSAGILSHPGIVTIYDIAEEGDLCFIFMEFVNGTTLERLAASGQLPAGAGLIEIFRQAAAALDYAHKRGIVHRDVKPANMMVDTAGVVKITDFGVAHFVSQDMTQTGNLTGTPSYMSPEQIQGHPVDGRADQHALAVIVYELLTGERPFAADSLPALVYRIVRDDAAPAHRINSTLNAGVDGVLRKALAKDPAARFASCTEFVNAVSAALATAHGWKPLLPGTVASMPTVALPGPVRPLPVLPAPPPPPAPRGRSGSVFRGILVGLLAGIAALAFALWIPRYWSDRPAPVPAAKALPEPKPAVITETRPQPVEPAPPPVTTTTPENTPPPDENQVEPVKSPEPAKPAPAQTYSVKILAEPEGARIELDEAALSCTSPCTIDLSPGRHTLRARQDGYRDALKIFEVPRNTEVKFMLSELAGQLIVRTNPTGATVYLNGKQQNQKTPAVLTVPVGHYRLILVREGYSRQEDNIEIRDGAISNYEFSWVQ
ncbi:MAG: serine/threonine-protein kinase [Bryobacteraceae bacterium]